MQGSTTNRGTFNLDRLKNSGEADGSGACCCHIDTNKFSQDGFVLPLKRHSAVFMVSGRTKRTTVLFRLVLNDEPVYRKSIGLWVELLNGIFQCFSGDTRNMFDNMKALLFKEVIFLCLGIRYRKHQLKSDKAQLALCGLITIQNSRRTGSHVTRKGIYLTILASIFLEICDGYHALASHLNFFLARNLQRYILVHTDRMRYILTNITVTACDCLYQMSITVTENNGQTVFLPRNNNASRHGIFSRLARSDKVLEDFNILGLGCGQHRLAVLHLLQTVDYCTARALRRRVRKNYTALTFHHEELIVQCIIFFIRHKTGVIVIVCIGILVEGNDQVSHYIFVEFLFHCICSFVIIL